MSNIRYSITFAAGAQMQMTGVLYERALPLLRSAVESVAAMAAADWQESVHKAKLWSGERDAYANSITWRMTGALTAMVEAGYDKAGDIETGRGPYDMKRMLDTSSKVRRTLDGRRFLVIPMRHNAPGGSRAMPSVVHTLAKKMAVSRVTSTSRRDAGEVVPLHPQYGMGSARPNTKYLSTPNTRQAATVAKHTYAWGDKITAQMLRQAGADKATAKRYAGMVRMNTSTGKAKSSSYMTFRIMMEGQTGKWILPAQPGMYLARDVAKRTQPRAEAAFAQAVAATFNG